MSDRRFRGGACLAGVWLGKTHSCCDAPYGLGMLLCLGWVVCVGAMSEGRGKRTRAFEGVEATMLGSEAWLGVLEGSLAVCTRPVKHGRAEQHSPARQDGGGSDTNTPPEQRRQAKATKFSSNDASHLTRSTL